MKHFMLDGFNSVQSKLDDMRYLYDFIVQTVNELNMSPIMPPMLLPYYHGDTAEDNGVSAFVLLCGGHFTIHTFTYRECYFADILYPEHYDTRRLTGKFREKLPFNCRIHPTILDRRLQMEQIEIDVNKPLEDQVGINTEEDFGPHFFAEVKNVKGNISMDSLFNMLEGLPKAVHMTPIMRPYVLKDKANNPSYISGMTMIAESHIAIHYEIESKTLYVDIFSCKFQANWKEFKGTLEKYFNSQIVFHFIARGSKYQSKADLSERKHKYDNWLDVVGYEK